MKISMAIGSLKNQLERQKNEEGKGERMID